MDRGYRTDEKISAATKWCFALGDIFQGGFFNIVNFFYSIFLTDVVGISPIWAANVFLLGKVWDAVTDPMMGIITDNTRTRLGRRRPYFLIGAPLVLLSFVMMWHPLSSGTETARVLYYIFVYMLISTVSDIVTVPFLAMSAELSTDYDERTAITNARMIVSILSSLICAVVPMMIVRLYQDVRTGYMVMSVVFGLFFAAPMLVVFFKVPERPQFAGSEKTAWKAMFSTLRLRIFRRFIWLYLGIVVSMDITAMIFAYYMTYNLGRPFELNAVLGVLLVAEVALVPLATRFAECAGKNRAIALGNLGWIACAAASMLISRESPGFCVYLLAALLGGVMSFSLIGFTSLFGDVTEVGEFYFGRRMEGSFSGIQQFIRKCAAAVANWAALTLLGIMGFVKPVKNPVDGAMELVLQPQSPQVLFTIKAILGLAAILLLIPATVISLRWKLTKKKHAVLIAYLDRKRAGLDIDPAQERQVQEICRPLI